MLCVLLLEIVCGQVANKKRSDQLYWAWGLERLLEDMMLELSLCI